MPTSDFASVYSRVVVFLKYVVEFSNFVFIFTLMKRKMPITIPQAQINHFCRQNHIRKLALFGSILRDDFREDSDIDVLVEFEPGHVPGLRFIRLERELSELFARKVDLNTPKFLSRFFRDQVLNEAEVLYAQE